MIACPGLAVDCLALAALAACGDLLAATLRASGQTPSRKAHDTGPTMVTDDRNRPDYGFVITLADEGVAQLETCLGRLRAAYPDAPATVVVDGVHDPDYAPACGRHGVRFVQGAYLKRLECGGAWWRRTLEAGLSLGTPWIVKLDPDAVLWRPFRTSPPADVSGTVENAGSSNENVQGGVQAISAAAARRILGSGRLDDPALREQRVWAADNAARRHYMSLAYLSTDATLMWLCRNVGVTWGDWSEVGSRWLSPPANNDLALAATHPHKVAAPPRYPAAPLRVITTCKGRLAHLRRTLPLWLAEPGVAVTVVDYDCPEGTAAWVRANHPEVDVVRVRGSAVFHLSRARNLGAEASTPGWWCFFDADTIAGPGWSAAVRGALRDGSYLRVNPIAWDQFGIVVCHSDDFRRAGGYDRLIRGYACEDAEFYARLRAAGVRPRPFDAPMFSSVPHGDGDRTKFYDHKDRSSSQTLFDAYLRRKRTFMVDAGRLPSEAECVAMLDAARAATGIDPGYYGVPVDPDLVVEHLPGRKTVPGPGTTTVEVPIPPDVLATIEGEDDEPVEAASSASTRRVAAHSDRDAFAGPRDGDVAAEAMTARTLRGDRRVTVSLVNHATVDLGIPLDGLARVLEAHSDVLDEYWAGTSARVIPTAKILPNTMAVVLVDDPAHAREIGYRDLTPDGKPLVQVYVKDALVRGIPVTLAASHCCAELLVDPRANRTDTARCGALHAREVCDPVDGISFKIGPYRVADFVTPAWFDPDSPPGGRCDHVGAVDTPFAVHASGYATAVLGHAVTIVPGSIAKRDEMTAGGDHQTHRRDLRAERHRRASTLVHGQYLARGHR